MSNSQNFKIARLESVVSGLYFLLATAPYERLFLDNLSRI